ncbi:hypothetical protein [Brevibacterium sp. 2SA]|uniref:hypothetical protein n=1 Tax=Brevibacterium sp. 2SA TaxID=2502198 RepID=UPI0010F91079|nr:hypothetical protein [Brevibacterium sp. 2SA]
MIVTEAGHGHAADGDAGEHRAAERLLASRHVLNHDRAAAKDSVLGTRWITVDLERIRRLPHRLRCLWPKQLLPTGDRAGAASSRATASAGMVVTPTAAGLPEHHADVVRPRDLDVLSAWLAGFASELNLTRFRLGIVVGGADAALTLEIAVCAETALAMLALRGADFSDFAGFEFLRRLDITDLAVVGEELADLITGDCVLTLTYAGVRTRSGMEFLHRQGDTWLRPLLERGTAGVTVAEMEDVGAEAVRMLIAATLTELTRTEEAAR